MKASLLLLGDRIVSSKSFGEGPRGEGVQV